MLTEYVRDRLAHLLAENRPRRASPREVSVFDRVTAARVRDDGSGPPDFEPSDDGDDGTVAGRSGARRAEAPSVALPPPDVGRDLLDDDYVPPRRTFSRMHVAVISALLLIGLLSSGWAVLRARPVAIASTSPSAVASQSNRTGAPVPLASDTPAPSIMVHVLGAVKKPGVVTLPEQSRVRDAIKAAGGLRREAAPGDLNLAQVLSDGQQVVIGTDKAPSGEVRDGSQQSGSSDGFGSKSGTTSRDGGGATMNLNTASQSQLEELPGVGPVTAGKIVAWREEHGRFSRVEELQEVDGIGPKTFAEIAPHARV